MKGILGAAMATIALTQAAHADDASVTPDQCDRLTAQVEAMAAEIERKRETIAELRGQTVRLMGSADTGSVLTDSKNVGIASFDTPGSERPSALPVVEEICGAR